MSDVDWLTILRAEVAKSSCTAVADQIGYSRSAVSLVLSGTYAGSTDRIGAKVIETFTTYVNCPHTGGPLAQMDCAEVQARPMPTSDAKALRHWTSCRGGCPHFRGQTQGGCDAA